MLLVDGTTLVRSNLLSSTEGVLKLPVISMGVTLLVVEGRFAVLLLLATLPILFRGFRAL